MIFNTANLINNKNYKNGMDYFVWYPLCTNQRLPPGAFVKIVDFFAFSVCGKASLWYMESAPRGYPLGICDVRSAVNSFDTSGISFEVVHFARKSYKP